MIRSMTGFGDAERPTAAGLLRAEIRTVNHRFLNTSYRTPPGFDRMEQEFAGWIRSFVSRGHVTLTLTLDAVEVGASEPLPELDLERARGWAGLLRRLKDELDLAGEVELAQVARMSDVFRRPDARERAEDVDEDDVRTVVEEALRAVVGMREAEGDRLRADMEGRLEGISTALGAVERRAPERLTRERDRLREAVRDLTEKEEVDEDRLAREIAYLAEKWDINEEIVRFHSHV
ncbi:MAG: YicC/YloC family endoribonuclease, partial [Gemmatimonadota bacterium]